MKPRVSVHKFSSCDGCQLAFINAGPALLELAGLVDIVHFAEAGPMDPDAPVDIAFVEGSISTQEEAVRIRRVRESARYLISIGACATAGGLQALRNFNAQGVDDWTRAIYARPEFIESLDKASAISDQVKVDLELWGCPVNAQQVFTAIRRLLFGALPFVDNEKVCQACKRQGIVCVLVTRGTPCLGPVTRTGCGAICPAFGRDCYGCFGPAETPNTAPLSRRFQGLGLMPEDIARRFHFINSQAPGFLEEGRNWDQGTP
ncbi:sulfhydrogenase subunit delta [Ectothiorhodospira variabilis]|uniref:NADH-quinone oxidoreductase subunit B family protein n=1 Tax=Ectothiorhodospira variabilis TaxID=505694 RepID=UPI001EFBC986|nr:sulfhydrogenase subunit delta [Ectothiorhodospira variabilis]MCG5495610.1 sulfhydrogenase subunit delta [Ectothiorhodospira variabilis]MCG5503078.1 sulfhydrogenase subunit delta [Ectothiorhodospira variabilis]MCG5506163.1 sulfhydrogenase subunit delta [Ectothiorhodospira variabilis]